MGKKQRRKQRKVTAPVPAPVAQLPVGESTSDTAKTGAGTMHPPAQKPRAGTDWSEFRDRYRHVNVELKRIGILAGSFLVVLLILTAILT